MGMPDGRSRRPEAAPFAVGPNIDPEFWTRGKMEAGMFRILKRSLSHFLVRILNINVREALVMSVAWDLPPVNYQMSQLSIVPKHICPFCARRGRPFMLSKYHFIFVPEK